MTRKQREKIAEVSYIVRYGLIGIYIIASIVYIWASAYPASIRESEQVRQQINYFIVEREEALAGANPTELNFSNLGTYSVTYRGTTYLISDISTQNQINRFIGSYGSNGCGRAQIEDTIWTATIILFGVGLCFLNYFLYLQAMYRIGLKYCCEKQHSYSKL